MNQTPVSTKDETSLLLYVSVGYRNKVFASQTIELLLSTLVKLEKYTILTFSRHKNSNKKHCIDHKVTQFTFQISLLPATQTSFPGKKNADINIAKTAHQQIHLSL